MVSATRPSETGDAVATVGNQSGVAHDPVSASFMAYVTAIDINRMLIQGSNLRLPIKPTRASERNPVSAGPLHRETAASHTRSTRCIRLPAVCQGRQRLGDYRYESSTSAWHPVLDHPVTDLMA
jgi:hypothetical protein